jgi:hypothetical protein
VCGRFREVIRPLSPARRERDALVMLGFWPHHKRRGGRCEEQFFSKWKEIVQSLFYQSVDLAALNLR